MVRALFLLVHEAAKISGTHMLRGFILSLVEQALSAAADAAPHPTPQHPSQQREMLPLLLSILKTSVCIACISKWCC